MYLAKDNIASTTTTTTKAINKWGGGRQGFDMSRSFCLNEIYFSSLRWEMNENDVWTSKELGEEMRGQFHQHFTCSFYAPRSQKRQRDSQVKQLFAFLGSAQVKAETKHVDEIDPRRAKVGGGDAKIFFPSFDTFLTIGREILMMTIRFGI